MLQYISLSNYYSHIPLHHPSHHQYQMHSHHYARHLRRRVSPVPFTHKAHDSTF
ncbi:ADS_G0043170.mRNA.1.CDS.1 [Saccharomyces cerevisiae]|nr:ADS_G0043170.mRNA.1.CDS.1 [Saccharomyces cerevisiae]CAI6849655.1 ADS_G0043170.mRNA.1.CDS.1 [Saccharomyces cerevisiae]